MESCFGTIKTELELIEFADSPAAIRELAEYVSYYNTERAHSSRDHLPPAWESAPPRVETLPLKDVVCTTRLGGVLRSYSRRAA